MARNHATQKNNKNAIKNFDKLEIYKQNNKDKFDSWKILIGNVKRFRNDLAHIAKDIKYDTKNIGGELNKALKTLEQIISQNPNKIHSNSLRASKNKDGALQMQLQKLKNP